MPNIFDYIPPDGEKKGYRIQPTLSIKEAAAIESIANNPALPFEGDQNRLVRTLLRAGIAAVHEQTQVESDAFVQSISPVLGSELLKWSTAACDTFAVSATDHLQLATSAGDPDVADDVILQVQDVIASMKNESAKMMLIRALSRRGFVAATGELRRLLLELGKDVYHLDNVVAEMFT